MENIIVVKSLQKMFANQTALEDVNFVALLNKGKVQLLDEPQKLRRIFSDSTMTLQRPVIASG